MEKKDAVKIKDAKFSDLYKTLHLNSPSAKSLHTCKRVQSSVQCMSLFLTHYLTHPAELVPVTLPQ